MPELHFPWLESAIVTPLLGAIIAYFIRDGLKARMCAIMVATLTFAFAIGEFIDFSLLASFEAHDHWDLVTFFFNQDIFVIDELSAPLLPLATVVYLVAILATLRTKIQRFSFPLTLLSESILIATFSCRASWVLVALLSLATVPPWLELRARNRCTRVFTLHMGLFILLLSLGYGLLHFRSSPKEPALLAGALLTAATLLRSGIVPVHCWMTDLFEKASFGTAILFVTPLTGAFAVMRLVLPVAPDWALHWIALLSLVTAIYASGMALVQSEARRFFCYLFLSNASLVLVGLELVTPIGLTGALCVWLSVGLSLTGFGLTLRSIESRIGRVSLTDYHGLYDQMPSMAGFFLLTGLAAIGFPGTIGFIAIELLVEGAVEVYPQVGSAVVIAAALNGIAILHAYFRIFTGRRPSTHTSLTARWPERVSVLLLTLLIVGGGIAPQSSVASRYHAAVELRRHRENFSEVEPGTSEHAEKETHEAHQSGTAE
ncbi:MAG: proton-conducting transporter membrane subunit [Pirellulaceae bacterium]|nr:proton-conducting transporter membrane subunit [Pirellulaceae bacterium]